MKHSGARGLLSSTFTRLGLAVNECVWSAAFGAPPNSYIDDICSVWSSVLFPFQIRASYPLFFFLRYPSDLYKHSGLNGDLSFKAHCKFRGVFTRPFYIV